MVTKQIKGAIGFDLIRIAREQIESIYPGVWTEWCYVDEEAVPGTTIYGCELQSEAYRYGLRITRSGIDPAEVRLLDRWGGGQSKIDGEGVSTGRRTRPIDIYDVTDVLDVLRQCQTSEVA